MFGAVSARQLPALGPAQIGSRSDGHRRTLADFTGVIFENAVSTSLRTPVSFGVCRFVGAIFSGVGPTSVCSAYSIMRPDHAAC